MRIPKLAEARLYTKRLDSFGGIRRVGQVRDGEFSDAVNFTNDDYPYLKTRKYRLIMDKADEMTAAYPVNGIFEMPSFGSGYDGIGVVRGEHVFINGKQVLAGTDPFDLNSEDAQDIVMMGAYALFFPAKKYVNLSRLYSVPAGLRSDDYGDVTCPDMDIIMSSGNRLWGAKYGNVEREGAMVTVNEVYASKLGDFNTWTTSSESSTSAGDPYTVSIGAPGYFTGACELNNKPVFFKEDYIISVYGTEPANFQVRTDEAEGVRLGCARTVSVSNGAAYYVGKHGVYVYGGGTPVLISEELGDSGDGMRQAQAERYSIFNGAGSGAVFNGKYYVNARLFPESFERFTFVYDIGRRSWQRAAHETDDTAEAINSFIVVSDYLLYTPEVDTVIPDPVTVSGSAVSFTGAAADWPLKDLTASIVPVQSGSGDPSPTNIRPISGWTECKVYRSGADTSDPTIYTVSFGSAGTVYGGTLDVTTGTLTVDRAIVDLGTLNWIYIGKFYAPLDGAKIPVTQKTVPDIMCSCYFASDYYKLVNATVNKAIGISPDGSAYVRDTAYNNAANFKSAMSGVQLCYELAEPIVYHLSPVEIRTLAGQNTIWADTGDVTVKYIPEFTVDNNVYGITNHQDVVPVAEEDEEQTDGVPFEAVTGRIGYETHDHKTLSRVTVRMRVGAGDGRKIRYSLNYDDEKDANEEIVWRDVHEIAAAPIRTFTLSVRPRRCDHFQMKIEGRGDVEVYSVEYVYEYGSDLANHILN